MKRLRLFLLEIMIVLVLMLPGSCTVFSESASLTTVIQVRVNLPPQYYSAGTKEIERGVLSEERKNDFSNMDIMRVDKITKGTRELTVYTFCEPL